MNYVLVFRPDVRNELDNIYRWYESQQSGLGDYFLVVLGVKREAKFFN